MIYVMSTFGSSLYSSWFDENSRRKKVNTFKNSLRIPYSHKSSFWTYFRTSYVMKPKKLNWKNHEILDFLILNEIKLSWVLYLPHISKQILVHLAALKCTVACTSVNANNATILRPLFGELNFKQKGISELSLSRIIIKPVKMF